MAMGDYWITCTLNWICVDHVCAHSQVSMAALLSLSLSFLPVCQRRCYFRFSSFSHTNAIKLVSEFNWIELSEKGRDKREVKSVAVLCVLFWLANDVFRYFVGDFRFAGCCFQFCFLFQTHLTWTAPRYPSSMLHWDGGLCAKILRKIAANFFYFTHTRTNVRINPSEEWLKLMPKHYVHSLSFR